MEQYRAYLLESTGDATDRTLEIEHILKRHGACLLGSGSFYVSGIKMPNHTSLMGLGTATRLILNPALTEGCCVEIGSYCTVKNLSLYGAEGEIPAPAAVGARHGLLFRGVATVKEYDKGIPHNAIVSDCLIRYFSGGGITCVDTGYLVTAAMTASNCHIMQCGVGINIAHFSEFHKFTNILCAHNLYGCINNGGNNLIANCGFDCNKTGMLIDNSRGQSPNNSHGTVTGCTFNHSGNNDGIGIHILGAKHGHVFSACQVFFSKIVIENAVAIQFSNINVGKTEISITGGQIVTFTGCLFQVDPPITLSADSHVKFINCYTRAGESIPSDNV